MLKRDCTEQTDSGFLNYIYTPKKYNHPISEIQKMYVVDKINIREISEKTTMAIGVTTRIIDEIIRRKLLTIN